MDWNILCGLAGRTCVDEWDDKHHIGLKGKHPLNGQINLVFLINGDSRRSLNYIDYQLRELLNYIVM